MLSLSASGINSVLPTKIAPTVDWAKEKVFSVGLFASTYTKIDDMTKPIATTLTSKYDEAAKVAPVYFKQATEKIDTYLPPTADEKPKSKTAPGPKLTEIPGESFTYVITLAKRSKSLVVTSVTSTKDKAVAVVKEKYTKVTTCDCAKDTLKKIESFLLLAQTDYIIPAKKAITEFGTPYYTMVFESKIYCDAKKQVEYYNKALLPHYEKAVAWSKEMLKVWPISVFVEYAVLAKTTIAKNLPVQWSGAVGGAA